jgi:hypothetical protein
MMRSRRAEQQTRSAERCLAVGSRLWREIGVGVGVRVAVAVGVTRWELSAGGAAQRDGIITRSKARGLGSYAGMPILSLDHKLGEGLQGVTEGPRREAVPGRARSSHDGLDGVQRLDADIRDVKLCDAGEGAKRGHDEVGW